MVGIRHRANLLSGILMIGVVLGLCVRGVRLSILQEVPHVESITCSEVGRLVPGHTYGCVAVVRSFDNTGSTVTKAAKVPVHIGSDS